MYINLQLFNKFSSGHVTEWSIWWQRVSCLVFLRLSDSAFQQTGSAPAIMATNTPFPEFKTTGDDKHDIEVFIEDLTDYCIMQNWFDPSKDTDAAKWTKPVKAMTCLRAPLSPAARAVYKYSLVLAEDDQKKLHMVLNALREYYGASIGVSGE